MSGGRKDPKDWTEDDYALSVYAVESGALPDAQRDEYEAKNRAYEAARGLPSIFEYEDDTFDQVQRRGKELAEARLSGGAPRQAAQGEASPTVLAGGPAQLPEDDEDAASEEAQRRLDEAERGGGQPTAAKQPPAPGEGEAAWRGFRSGSTLGFGDELSAGLQRLMLKAGGVQGAPTAERGMGGAVTGTTTDYRNIRDEERAADDAARTENPKTFMAAELLGGALPVMAAGPAGAFARGGAGAVRAGQGARAAVQAGKGAMQARKVARAAMAAKEATMPVADKALLSGARGVVSGFVPGAVAGAGHSTAEDAAGIAQDAGIGAGVGMVAGAALEPLAAGAVGALRGSGNKARGRLLDPRVNEQRRLDYQAMEAAGADYGLGGVKPGPKLEPRLKAAEQPGAPSVVGVAGEDAAAAMAPEIKAAGQGYVNTARQVADDYFAANPQKQYALDPVIERGEDLLGEMHVSGAAGEVPVPGAPVRQMRKVLAGMFDQAGKAAEADEVVGFRADIPAGADKDQAMRAFAEQFREPGASASGALRLSAQELERYISGFSNMASEASGKYTPGQKDAYRQLAGALRELRSPEHAQVMEQAHAALSRRDAMMEAIGLDPKALRVSGEPGSNEAQALSRAATSYGSGPQALASDRALRAHLSPQARESVEVASALRAYTGRQGHQGSGGAYASAGGLRGYLLPSPESVLTRAAGLRRVPTPRGGPSAIMATSPYEQILLRQYTGNEEGR